MAGYNFQSESDINRVIRATKQVEQDPTNMRGRGKPGVSDQTMAIWARLTAFDEVTGSYKWTKLTYSNDVEKEYWRTKEVSGKFAYEANMAHVTTPTVVYLQKTGRDKDGNTVWRFTIGGDAGFYAKVVSSSEITNFPNRFEYTFIEAKLQKEGRWEEVEDGLQDISYNTNEAGNVADGALGNGMHTNMINSPFELAPIGNGAVVWIRAVVNCDGELEYQFTQTNMVKGPPCQT